MPPCDLTIGRHTLDRQTSVYRCLSDNINLSQLTDVSLKEYVALLPEYCRIRHQVCAECPGLMKVANDILAEGFVKLSSAFRSAFPDVKYHIVNAKCKLLKMPVASLRIGDPNSGASCVYLLELQDNVDYKQVLNLLNQYHSEKSSQDLPFSKTDLKAVLSLATSDKERELIRYTACRVSGLTATAAEKHYGIQGMNERVKRVEL